MVCMQIRVVVAGQKMPRVHHLVSHIHPASRISLLVHNVKSYMVILGFFMNPFLPPSLLPKATNDEAAA